MENLTIESTYEEKVEKYKVMWDNFSQTYYNSLNKNSLCLMSTLMALTRVSSKRVVLDAGCGPGLGTKILMAEIPNYDSTVYAFNFSPEMIKICEEVFKNNLDFNSNSKNYWEIVDNLGAGKKINVEEDTLVLRKSKPGKILKFFEGNAENLVFEDEQFDVYLSSLCLMLCLDADKAMSEAYRVLKKCGGVAAFSIWGKKRESKLIQELFTDVFKKYGIDTAKDRTSFSLAEDEDALRERFLKAGFRDVRMEYTSEIYDCYDEDDFLTKFSGPMVKKALAQVKDETLVPKILEEVRANARKKIVDEKILPTLSILNIVAFK